MKKKQKMDLWFYQFYYIIFYYIILYYILLVIVIYTNLFSQY